MNEIENNSGNKSASSSRNNVFFTKLNRWKDLLGKRWWVLVLVPAAAFGIQMWMLKNAPPEYHSIGQMIINVKISTPRDYSGSVYSEENNNFLGTQAAIMEGPTVTGRAYESLKAQFPTFPRDKIKLSAKILPKTSIFILETIGNEPTYTQKFLQRVMDEYVNLKKEMAANTADTTTTRITEQLHRLEPEIARNDEQVAMFLRTNNVTMFQELNSVNSFLMTLYQHLSDAKAEYDLLTSMPMDDQLATERHLRTLHLAPNTAMESSSKTEGDAMNYYISIKEKVTMLQEDKELLNQYLKPMHPAYKRLENDIYSYSRLIKARKVTLTEQIQSYEKQIKEAGANNFELNRKNSEYERLNASAKRMQSLYDLLLTSLQSLDVGKNIINESVTIYQPASEGMPDESIPFKKIVIALLAGFALSLVILFAMDSLNDSVNSIHELNDHLEDQVLGQIPRERFAAALPSLATVHTDQSHTQFVESFRNIRSALLYYNHGNHPAGANGSHPRRLLITSSLPSDGKSLTSSNLAVSLAMSGSTVLLIDADLRKGRIQEQFRIKSQVGLGQILKDKIKWQTVVCETDIKGLHVIPRGPFNKATADMFFAEDMELFLSETDKSYDYILIDTPPVMVSDDAGTLAPRVDGVLFVVRAGVTSMRVANASLNLLKQRKAKVLGLVLNAVRAGIGDYYYGYYKHYYHDKS